MTLEEMRHVGDLREQIGILKGRIDVMTGTMNEAYQYLERSGVDDYHILLAEETLKPYTDTPASCYTPGSLVDPRD